jgi:hypothetical protein
MEALGYYLYTSRSSEEAEENGAEVFDIYSWNLGDYSCEEGRLYSERYSCVA